MAEYGVKLQVDKVQMLKWGLQGRDDLFLRWREMEQFMKLFLIVYKGKRPRGSDP